MSIEEQLEFPFMEEINLKDYLHLEREELNKGWKEYQQQYGTCPIWEYLSSEEGMYFMRSFAEQWRSYFNLEERK